MATWLQYDCPFCSTQMQGVSMAHLRNSKGAFVRTLYSCQCGYKLGVVVPYHLAAQRLSLPPQSDFKYVGSVWRRLGLGLRLRPKRKMRAYEPEPV